MEKQIKDFVAVNFIFQKECEDMEDLIRKWESSRWISVKERLPEILGYYLIYYCEDWNYDKLKKIGFAFYNSSKEFCLENSKVNPYYWMPLPEAPE